MNVPNSDDLLQDVIFPLPYRIAVLLSFGILAWAANLHGLSRIGIDAISALDRKVDDLTDTQLTTTHRPSIHSDPTDTSVEIKSTYKIFIAFSGYNLASWSLYRLGTMGDPALVDIYRFMPALHIIILVLITFCPYDVFFKAERQRFVRCVTYLRATDPSLNPETAAQFSGASPLQ